MINSPYTLIEHKSSLINLNYSDITPNFFSLLTENEALNIWKPKDS